MASYTVKFGGVNIQSNSGGESITINEQPSGVSDTIPLVDGKTSYTTSNSFNGSGSVSIEMSIGPPSTVTNYASVTGPITVTPLATQIHNWKINPSDADNTILKGIQNHGVNP